MSKNPLVRGRFEFNAEEGTLTIEFSSGRRVVLGPEQEAGFEKVLRGEVPISVTGGKVAQKSALLWHQQLAGAMDNEVKSSRSVITPEPRLTEKVKRYDKRGRLEITFEDLSLESLMADFLDKEDAA